MGDSVHPEQIVKQPQGDGGECNAEHEQGELFLTGHESTSRRST